MYACIPIVLWVTLLSEIEKICVNCKILLDDINIIEVKKLMKSLAKFILLILSLSLLTSCGVTDTEKEDGGAVNEFTMKAKLLANEEKLEVDVIEAEYASGNFHIIVPEETDIYGSDGEKIKKSDLKVGDLITISYSGQIMMSYPPQTVALKIRVN